MNEYDELLKLEKRKFWLRAIMLTLILIALIYVGLTAGGDPCIRCKLRVEQWGNEVYDCRQIIKEVIPMQENIINESKYNVNWSLGLK